jgi:hypothetical protein
MPIAGRIQITLRGIAQQDGSNRPVVEGSTGIAQLAATTVAGDEQAPLAIQCRRERLRNGRLIDSRRDDAVLTKTRIELAPSGVPRGCDDGNIRVQCGRQVSPADDRHPAHAVLNHGRHGGPVAIAWREERCHDGSPLAESSVENPARRKTQDAQRCAVERLGTVAETDEEGAEFLERACLMPDPRPAGDEQPPVASLREQSGAPRTVRYVPDTGSARTVSECRGRGDRGDHGDRLHHRRGQNLAPPSSMQRAGESLRDARGSSPGHGKQRRVHGLLSPLR